ncbi:hypothetical protein K431DRAFT_288664 [Polychaeton citri CBS 116435]|uniref:Metallo-hydrolase/oxidoreductase n=1 Tax=Polychaeton citri CBS 116435 TaxID=1314669 RepID=A0A9P4UKZ5_9PEZI|nr:hypothetical protein K431DRAFT_288664 [Polychaeton citri CBS 116435]
MTSKRSHSALNTATEDDDPIDPSDELKFTALGGGNEVGRSCHIIEYKGKTVMLDAGVHPAYEGFATLPFYDEFDLSTVDVLLITHFHMDHAASLPYVLAKTNFAGKVYMTHPTKAFYKHIMQDSVRVQNTYASSNGTDGSVAQLYNEQDLLTTLPLIQTISFNTTHTHNGIRFTPYPAGHVLGACMYLVEIAGLNILFTGDYSRESDRHLIPASVPKGVRIDCLITESTFGVSTHTPRQEREASLMKSVTGILNRGGRALLPVFAIGRAQELLLILEEYWHRHADYQKFPIYYASSLARKCMVIYQTYIDSMNENIRNKLTAAAAAAASGGANSFDQTTGNPISTAGPWDFQFIRSLKDLSRFDDIGPCVMLASPGMLQNGVSRTLLERWAPESKNGVVITGYSVEGTMAKQIMLEPDSIPAVMTNRAPVGGPLGPKRPGGAGADGEKVMIPRRCTVQEYSFAAHVDGSENRKFIEEVDAPVVILVHGEKHNMARLKSRLLSANKKWTVYSPVNCEEVRIPFRQDKIVRVVGRLASDIVPPTLLLPSPPASDGDAEDAEAKRQKLQEEHVQSKILSGVLVQNDFKLSLMAPEDLKEYAGLATTTIICRQRLSLASASIELIRWALEGTFGNIDVSITGKQTNGNGIKEEEDATINGDEHTGEATTMSIIGDAVRLICHSPSSSQSGVCGELELEWEGNALNDSIADAVMAVLLSVESSPAAVKQSSRLHGHHHHHGTNGHAADDNDSDAATQNPYANITPDAKLSRMMMFLEAQFGEDAITPIAEPPLPRPASADGIKDEPMQDAEESEEDVAAVQKQELARLHALGIPVPGLLIKVDKHIAKVWLEGGDVECANKSLGDRVRAVVERGFGTVGGIGI